MGQTTLSFEIFPPNKESAAEKLTETLDELVGLSPDFISVTCTNKNDDLARLTVKLAGYVKNRLNVPSIAHLPAAYLDKQQVSEILNQYADRCRHHADRQAQSGPENFKDQFGNAAKEIYSHFEQVPG